MFPQNLLPWEIHKEPVTEPQQSHIPHPQTCTPAPSAQLQGTPQPPSVPWAFTTSPATLHSLKIGYFLLHCVDSSSQSPSADFYAHLGWSSDQNQHHFRFHCLSQHPCFHMDSLLTAVSFLIIPQLQAHSNKSNSFNFTNQGK